MPPWDHATSLLQVEQWAADMGVELELLGEIGNAHPLTLSWIRRLPSTPAGRGRDVIHGLLMLADKHQQSVELVSSGGVTEEYYAGLGFLSQLTTRDEDTNDVGMCREAQPLPAAMGAMKPKRPRPRS